MNQNNSRIWSGFPPTSGKIPLTSGISRWDSHMAYNPTSLWALPALCDHHKGWYTYGGERQIYTTTLTPPNRVGTGGRGWFIHIGCRDTLSLYILITIQHLSRPWQGTAHIRIGYRDSLTPLSDHMGKCGESK